MFKVTDNEHDRVPDELLKSVINRDTGIMGNICFMHILQMAREINELRYQVGIARQEIANLNAKVKYKQDSIDAAMTELGG